MPCNLCNDEGTIEQIVPDFDGNGNEVGAHSEQWPCPYLSEPDHAPATCAHCKHFHDWPMAEGQEEPSGDPGDGLGVQGVCCDCGTEQSA